MAFTVTVRGKAQSTDVKRSERGDKRVSLLSAPEASRTDMESRTGCKGCDVKTTSYVSSNLQREKREGGTIVTNRRLISPPASDATAHGGEQMQKFSR